MYETMVFWESPPGLATQPPVVQDFARIWQAADKIVYSETLQTVTSARAQVVREFDPEAVRERKATATRDLAVGGPEVRPRRSRLDWSITRASRTARRLRDLFRPEGNGIDAVSELGAQDVMQKSNLWSMGSRAAEWVVFENSAPYTHGRRAGSLSRCPQCAA
jgi:hypothetical protein